MRKKAFPFKTSIPAAQCVGCDHLRAQILRRECADDDRDPQIPVTACGARLRDYLVSCLGCLQREGGQVGFDLIAQRQVGREFEVAGSKKHG